MRYDTNNPYNDYSIFLRDLTTGGDEYFNEQISDEYKLKNNYHMILEQISFYNWELNIRKSYINSYINKNRHLLARVIIDMSFSIFMTSWFLYQIYFFAAIDLKFFGVYLELVFIFIGIVPSMGYGLSTLLEYLTTKEFSYAERISIFLGRGIPGNEIKNLHIEIATLERKILELEDLSESLYTKAEHLLEKSEPFFMDRTEPFIAPTNNSYRAMFSKLTLELENTITQIKNLTKDRDNLLFQHKFVKEKATVYTIITILAYFLYFTTYYSLPESTSYIVSIGGFIFILLPLIISTSKLLFQCSIKEEFRHAMEIQLQIDALKTEKENLISQRNKLEQ